MIEKTVFENVTTEELRKGKKHTVFTIYHIPIKAKTESGKTVTVNAELAVDNKYYVTYTWRSDGFSIKGETLYNNLLTYTDDTRGRYPTASVDRRNGKIAYTGKDTKFTYDPEAKTLTVENKVDTKPRKLSDYFIGGNVEGSSKFLAEVQKIATDIDGPEAIVQMEQGRYTLSYEKRSFSLDQRVLKVESKPAKDRWGNVRYTVSMYTVEGEDRVVRDLTRVVLAANGMPLSITVSPQASYGVPKNPYESTKKVICKKQGRTMNVDYDEACEALEVLQYRLALLEHARPADTERVVFYLKRGKHTKDNPITMGAVIDALGIKLGDARDILDRLMNDHQVMYTPAVKARDDLVYYTEEPKVVA